jgi:hypothetical protein
MQDSFLTDLFHLNPLFPGWLGATSGTIAGGFVAKMVSRGSGEMVASAAYEFDDCAGRVHRSD